MALYDDIRFCAKVDLLKTENIYKNGSVVSDQPARTAQADPRRQCTQMTVYANSNVYGIQAFVSVLFIVTVSMKNLVFRNTQTIHQFAI